jgi:CRP-like cAMP-binding protein
MVTNSSFLPNSLLAALPRRDYQHLLASLEPVTLTFGEVLYEPGKAIRHVFFPVGAMVSLLTLVEGHKALEVGMVGFEGMLGIGLALGIGVSPVRALVQGAGPALRMKAASFLAAFRQSPLLQREIYHYAHTLMAQITQTAACNRFHVVEARLARWLLMTRERVRSDRFRLTQDLLANMLGVRRVGVTKAARALLERKLIRYSRGSIEIIDRKGLEAASCRCYQVVKSPCNEPESLAVLQGAVDERPLAKRHLTQVRVPRSNGDARMKQSSSTLRSRSESH